LVLVLIVALPGINVLIPFSRSGETFSEIWLLGPEHTAEFYPHNIRSEEAQGPIYLGVRNHMASSAYYLVYVKLRNQTQPAPNGTTSKPSPVPPIYEFRFFLADNETWETPITFMIGDIAIKGDTCYLDKILINNQPVKINHTSTWDPEENGFYCQLFFELWVYEITSEQLQFDNSYVGIWLNITRS
jgi:uncharacterized membrane protein